MENLFIKYSSQNVEKLRVSKQLLERIVDQITSAYANVHVSTKLLQSSTIIYIGCHPNKNCTHKFEVNSEGIITYTSYSVSFFDIKGEPNPVATELVEKYPKSIFYNSDFTLTTEIESEEDFLEKAKDIVLMFERDGFVLKR